MSADDLTTEPAVLVDEGDAPRPAYGTVPMESTGQLVVPSISRGATVTTMSTADADALRAEPVADASGSGAVPPTTPLVAVGGPDTPAERPGGAQQGLTVLTDEPVPDTRPHRKVATFGYTTSRQDGPFADESWELWGMNNLHKHPDIAEHLGRFSRWYNLHDLTDLAKPEAEGGDPGHLTWLQQPHPFPIYLMDPMEGVLVTPEGDPMPSLAERTGFPSAVAFPKLQILSQFRRYFTNTVSWQLAHAVFEALHDESYILTDVGLFGIDMAIGTEYAAQRPSVEYFLGLMEGLGVQLHLPASSDLLKSAELYGGEDNNSGARAKVGSRLKELHQQKEQLENQLAQGQALHASICGAIDAMSYMANVWYPPKQGNGAARDAVLVPAGAVSPVAQMIAEGEARDRHSSKGP